MAQPLEERERLLAEARKAHREAERERTRARKLAVRYARRLRQTLSAAREQIDADRVAIDADRAAIDAKIAKLNKTQSEFHAVSAIDRDRLRDAWDELEIRQKRLAEEWDEANRFQTEQATALATRAAQLATRENAELEIRAKLQGEIAALREEAVALDARVRNARVVVEELEHRRAELHTEPAATVAPSVEPSAELQVALERTADRDLAKWSAELDDREVRLRQERSAIQSHFSGIVKDKAEMDDRRRVLAEQFSQLTAARAQWQEAEQTTVAEMEQLATTLRRRETELDACQLRLVRADGRRREDAYELWQLRLRLEAWQSHIVVYEMRWNAEREEIEADFARRESELARRQSLLANGKSDETDDAIPLAFVMPEGAPKMPVELTALRDELERMAAVLLEAELPEAPDAPESELPWGSEDSIPEATPEPEEADVLLFASLARAA